MSWLHFHEQCIFMSSSESRLQSQLFVEISDSQWKLINIIQLDSTNPHGAVTMYQELC